MKKRSKTIPFSSSLIHIPYETAQRTPLPFSLPTFSFRRSLRYQQREFIRECADGMASSTLEVGLRISSHSSSKP